MGVKLLWTGLTVFVLSAGVSIPAGAIVAGVIMLIGVILMWLDK